ncbi:hypothetical protein VTK26DRAFT_3288 [Humicola hyalothermophila]
MALSQGAIQVTAVSSIAATLSMIAISLRLWSRRILHHQLAFNDYMACVAMLFTAGVVSVAITSGVISGLGRHLDEIMATDPGMFALHLKASQPNNFLFVPFQLLWAAANSCVKLSILSLYVHLIPNRRFVILCYITMAATGAYFISVLLGLFLLCRPVRYSWDKSIPGGSCEARSTGYFVSGITNLALDVLVVIMPMPMLFGLRMTLRRRLGVACIFGLGGFTCVLSMLHVVWLRARDLSDMTYSVTPGVIYAMLEPTLGIVNACLPTIKPAVNKLTGRPIPYDVCGTGTARVTIATTTTTMESRNLQDQYARPRKGLEGLNCGITLVNISAEPLAHAPVHVDMEASSIYGHITVNREWAVRSV